MRLRYRRLVAICCIVLYSACARGDDTAVRAAFKERYKPHADKLQRFYYSNIRTKSVETLELTNGKQMFSVVDIRYDRTNVIFRSTRRSAKKEDPNSPALEFSEIEGSNARYDFRLKRKAEGQNVLVEARIHPPGKLLSPCYMAVPVASFFFGEKTFADMVEDESIPFLELAEGVWQNKPAMKLKVRLLRRFGKGNQETVGVFATYFFSPAEGWICRGMQGLTDDKASVTREEIYTYGPPGAEPYPPLQRIEVWIKDPSKPNPVRRTSITDITEFEHHKPFPESDFTLTAFGLPEPYGVVWKTGPPWYLWFIGSGVAFLAFGWYFKRRVQRRATTAPYPTSAD